METQPNQPGSKFRRNSKLAPLSQPQNPDIQPSALRPSQPNNQTSAVELPKKPKKVFLEMQRNLTDGKVNFP